MSTLHLVVPCYNEAQRLNLDPWLHATETQAGLSVLFIDDGSIDGTDQVLERICAAIGPQATWMRLPINQGKAEAVRRGMLRALERGCDVTGYWDADLATSLDEVPRLLRAMQADERVLVTMGARVRLMGRVIHRPPSRHYAGRSFATVASMLLGMSVYDTQCGAKLLRASDPIARSLERPFDSHWIFDVQLLARVVIHAGTPHAVAEVPLYAWRDVPGSKLRARNLVKALLELAKMRAELRQARQISQQARASTINDTPSGRST